jgi:gamma-glutamylcyclotransferase (GGCT)/AIG2-like uncharacterized protein YtfP
MGILLHIVLIARKNGMPIYYFGYGSNMSSAMMQAWCPNHKLIGAGQLLGWQLAFTRFSGKWGAGVADIIKTENALVWGGLYEISESDLTSLDIKEGNGNYYQRIECTILVDNQAYTAFTYVVIHKAPDGIPTSLAYRDTMLTGARELNLPEGYIRKIANLPLQD